MKSIAFESFGELLVLFASAVGTLLLTAGGIVIEFAALEQLTSGHLVMGAWEFWMGTILFGAGVYLLGYQQLYQRLQRPS